MKERLIKLWADYGLKYGKYVGYPFFYAACLCIFASLTFPYDKLKERIVTSFNAAQRASGGQQELQIEDLTGYWLSGVRMKGVTLLTAPAEAGKPATRIALDSLSVRYALLPALVGGSDLDFNVEAFGGGVRGSWSEQGKARLLDATLDRIDVGRIEPLASLLGVPLEGRLGGSVRLLIPDSKVSKASGQVAIESNGTAVGDGKAKLKGAIALPRLDVGLLTLNADVKDGVVKLTKFLAGGKDLDLQGDGRITLRDLVAESLCEMQVRFRINDGYRTKSDITKSLFGAPGSTAPALFELADPKVKESKRPDGFYAWSLRGQLGRLDFTPAPR